MSSFFIQVSAKIQQNFEWSVILKFTYSSTAFIFMWIISIVAMWEGINFRLFLSATVISLLTNVLNWIMNHYYFGVLFVNIHFSILNDELQLILNSTRSIQNIEQHSGTFTEVCCQLSDQLDHLAMIYSKLMKLAKKFNSLYQWQAAAICLTLYLSNISMVFWLYTMLKSTEGHTLSVSSFGFTVMSIGCISYYLDLKQLIRSVINMEDGRKQSCSILRQQKSFRQLDIRLERSVSRKI